MNIEELPGTPILPSPSARAMLLDVSDAAKSAMTLWKNRLYGGQGEKNAATSSYSPEEEKQKSESNREDRREETTTTKGREECNYVQYGIITRRMSAVIEIGEEGGAAADCQPIPRSPLPVVKQDEVILMKHIASDTSEMTNDTAQETCAESVASIAQDLVSIESGGADEAASKDNFTQEFAEEASENSGEEQGNEYVSAAYSISSIEQVKTEVANVLIKLSCSSESYESAVGAQQRKKKSRVQFAKAIVSEVRERPRIDPDDVHALFYTISDIERFEDEAEESSCDGSSFSTSFSYTITPTPSYLERDATDENETLVATEPIAKGRKIIGPDKVDDLVTGAFEALVAHLSSINASSQDGKIANPGSDSYGFLNKAALLIAEV